MASTHKKRLEKFEQATHLVRETFPRTGIQPASACSQCGDGSTDDLVLRDGVIRPIHGHCKERMAQELLEKVEKNVSTGSMPLGILGAILGGLIGCLPNIFFIWLSDDFSYYPILYALIPLASYFGYKTFKGVMSRGTPWIIMAISVICTVLQEYVFAYIILAQVTAMYTNYGFGFADFRFYLKDADLQFELMLEILKGLLWCALGIVITWKQISKNNSHTIKEAEQIRQSVGK